MPTFSRFARSAFRAVYREAQDVLVECDDVAMIDLEASWGLALRERWLMQLVYHDWSRTIASLNPGLRPVRLTRDYDLFILVCPWWRDVWYANAIEGWRDHCKTSVCWIDELWASEVPGLEYWLPVLSKFDHVIVAIGDAGRALGDAIGRPCREMQGGVDAIRFTPYPNKPRRVIDVYSIGRRHDGIHRTLLDLSARNGLFYVHDTLQNTGNSQAVNYREHRNMYANMAKRSRFFMVAPGKANVPEETGGQAIVGMRYFEGAAAGAVLVGQAPDCAAFRRHFDWPQAVIQIRPDGSDVEEVFTMLSAQGELVQEISVRNAKEALLRHDWVYRWREILVMAGLRPTTAMEAREERLRQLAELASEIDE